MISSKKLVQLSKKLEAMGGVGRRKATMTSKEIDASCTSVAGKANCIVYTTDSRRFEVPLAYLGTKVFEDLLRLSQEEFGFASDGRITLPCDTAVMEYVMCLHSRETSKEVEKALLSTIVMPYHTASGMMPSMELNQQLAMCSS